MSLHYLMDNIEGTVYPSGRNISRSFGSCQIDLPLLYYFLGVETLSGFNLPPMQWKILTLE